MNHNFFCTLCFDRNPIYDTAKAGLPNDDHYSTISPATAREAPNFPINHGKGNTEMDKTAFTMDSNPVYGIASGDLVIDGRCSTSHPAKIDRNPIYDTAKAGLPNDDFYSTISPATAREAPNFPINHGKGNTEMDKTAFTMDSNPVYGIASGDLVIDGRCSTSHPAKIDRETYM